MLHRVVALSLALVCFTLLPHAQSARAGACPSPQVRVYPANTVLAPTNVRVRLVFDEEEVTVHSLRDAQTRQILKTGFAKASTARVALRDQRGREVPVTLLRAPATRKPMLFVKPIRALAPGRCYDVLLRSGAEEYRISQLNTGAGPATTTPTLGKVEHAYFSAYPRARHWKDSRGRYAVVTLGGATGATAFEVHELDDRGIPSDATLRAVVEGPPSDKVVLRLEESSPCHGANFRFATVRKGARTHPLHLGIRALDDAGHQSALRQVTLDLSKPGRVVRPRSP